ncbi:hypothetical protein SKAU_G00028150 [Synaphobranchus kaupii]|uniref:Uncharacterized protein n=1 Tax=Synaphobranchus kaupii TaxID=118154 RepID=A0A9Q1GF17_SYNKA|nr:hypothetical protein SKAU_G00028150 [Synaphobranchus kaupii]
MLFFIICVQSANTAGLIAASHHRAGLVTPPPGGSLRPQGVSDCNHHLTAPGLTGSVETSALDPAQRFSSAGSSPCRTEVGACHPSATCSPSGEVCNDRQVCAARRPTPARTEREALSPAQAPPHHPAVTRSAPLYLSTARSTVHNPVFRHQPTEQSATYSPPLHKPSSSRPLTRTCHQLTDPELQPGKELQGQNRYEHYSLYQACPCCNPLEPGPGSAAVGEVGEWASASERCRRWPVTRPAAQVTEDRLPQRGAEDAALVISGVIVVLLQSLIPTENGELRVSCEEQEASGVEYTALALRCRGTSGLTAISSPRAKPQHRTCGPAGRLEEILPGLRPAGAKRGGPPVTPPALFPNPPPLRPPAVKKNSSDHELGPLALAVGSWGPWQQGAAVCPSRLRSSGSGGLLICAGPRHTVQQCHSETGSIVHTQGLARRCVHRAQSLIRPSSAPPQRHNVLFSPPSLSPSIHSEDRPKICWPNRRLQLRPVPGEASLILRKTLKRP